MNSDLSYCQDYFAYSRRLTREVKIGLIGIGNRNPIRVQSVITHNPLDTETCVNQIIELTDDGCEIVRIIIENKEQAANLENISKAVQEAGYFTPIVADIRTNSQVALEALQWVDKIRINPCHYPQQEDFIPVIKLCKTLQRAMRIGATHSSVCDCAQQGDKDNPISMVDRCLDLATIARDHDFHNFSLSIKTTEPKMMIQANRLLIAKLNELGPDWNYPIHLCARNAQDAEDGRIKSAISIGSLLADGIGDAIHVTLQNNPKQELSVVLTIIDDIQHSYIYSAATGAQRSPLIYNPYQYARRETAEIDVNGCSVGGNSPIRVFTNRIKWNKLSRIMDQLGPITPEGILEDSRVIAVDPYDTDTILMINAMENPQLVTVVDGAHGAAVIHAFRLLANKLSTRHSILLKDTLRPLNKRPRSPLTAQIKASRNLGSLLCDGIGDVILIQGESNPEKSIHLAFNILQATGLRGTPVNSPDSCQ